jgi:uncharacterized membrane protein
VSKRARFHVMLVIAAILGGVYGTLSDDSTGVAFFAGMAGVIAVIVILGNVFIEFAPDGSFRRRPRT